MHSYYNCRPLTLMHQQQCRAMHDDALMMHAFDAPSIDTFVMPHHASCPSRPLPPPLQPLFHIRASGPPLMMHAFDALYALYPTRPLATTLPYPTLPYPTLCLCGAFAVASTYTKSGFQRRACTYLRSIPMHQQLNSAPYSGHNSHIRNLLKMQIGPQH